jgi:hypothetical protein
LDQTAGSGRGRLGLPSERYPGAGSFFSLILRKVFLPEA